MKLAAAIADVSNDLFKKSDLGALNDMSCESMEKFNQTTRIDPDVTYLSWAGHFSLKNVSAKKFIVGTALGIATLLEKPSDGIIEVSSATAKGIAGFRLLGILPGVNQ